MTRSPTARVSRRRAFSLLVFNPMEAAWRNHLTPEELAEGDWDRPRRRSIRICIAGRRADLPRQDRQDPLPGTARGAGLTAVSRRRSPLNYSALRDLRCAHACARARASSAPASSRATSLLRRSALSASMRSIDRVRLRPARAATISSPSQLRLEQLRAGSRRYSLVELRRLEVAGEAVDHLAREVELRLLDRRLLDGLRDLGLRVDVLGEEQRLERERVALRDGSRQSARALRARTGRAPPSRSACIAASSSTYGRRCAGVSRAGRGSTCGRRRPGRRRTAFTNRVISIDLRVVERASIASRSASSTMTNWPFETSQPLTISSCVTSRSCVGHQRFCLIGVAHSRCRSRNETSGLAGSRLASPGRGPRGSKRGRS